MRVNGQHYRTVWMEGNSVYLINQNELPFRFSIHVCKTCEETCEAIRTMVVRGAGAIGATAGFAMAQAIFEGNGDERVVARLRGEIEATRPTAQNLFYATGRVSRASGAGEARKDAQAIADEDAGACETIGRLGNKLIQDGFTIETHCNAGWLAFVDYGSALAPIYEAHRTGKKIQVLVDETRPRSQGARLTAWELQNEAVPHVVMPDNAGAHFMSQGKVDMMITGSDRIAANGDVANKIGTLEKAIAAREYRVPFYVAAPTSTIDLACPSGKSIPIEERSEREVLFQTGMTRDGLFVEVNVACPGSRAINPAFDVTPAKFISGIITEKGVVKASPKGIASLFG